MEEKIIASLQEGMELTEKLKELAPSIARAARLSIECLKSGGKILICGNGGSAADSQHIAAELVGRFQRERRGLPALALTTDTSVLTSLANDYAFDRVFARQVEALARSGDLLLTISTSGNSPNVVEAIRQARAIGVKTIALLGRDGGRAGREADLSLIVPAHNTAQIQVGQSAVYHILCDLVEAAFSKP